MSAPGFGYSAGDFIAAVTLIAKVTKALKDVGGAREEYQALVGELDLLRQILAKLQAEPDSTPDDSSLDHAFANFARQQTKVTVSELTQFLERLSKFNSSIGEGSRHGWHRGIPRKTQWAVHYASEVEKMRVKLGTQLQIILVALSVNREQ